MCPSGTTTLRSEIHTVGSDLRPAFNVLDADHDGKISGDDLRKFYAGFSSGGADEEVIKTMMSVADLNKDGFVEYHEFERVLGTQKRASSSSGGVMEDVFRIMDKDGDGKLSHDDLKSYMEWAGFSAGDEDIKAMIRLGGGEEKDGVSYNGLLKILAIDFLV
jgi:calmodulin|uniref:EF-hand domain-containing protein n=1 Tax=Fagus sylvatica TaxID=28930 RepID=A0A2N9IPA2_FAGSY